MSHKEHDMIDPGLPVSAVMSTGAITVDEKLTLRSLAAVLSELDIGVALVVAPDGSVGVVSERDIVRALGDGADPDAVWAADVASAYVVYVDQDETVLDVAERMSKESVRHVPVLHEGAIIGVVSARDVLPVFVDDARAAL